MLQVALNGSRPPAEHPGIPRTPEELARESLASVDAGAHVVHVHAYDDGQETLAPEPCAAMVRAIRAACPGVPISQTTALYIAGDDPTRRLALVECWTELPDLVTANQGGEGIVELCEHLIGRGVGIEAGLLSVGDAEAFVESGIADRCTRAMIEPLEVDPAAAVAQAEATENVLSDAGIELEQVHHGEMSSCWAVCERGAGRGHGIRTGLEDVTVLPDGTPAHDNAELVRHAKELLITP
ncbi:MAG TPA: 3-keto-5-aminohexanoate cleavage protein [Gaiellaceae bacterium]|nr:3-keto-5-aminohexanoate cleavage protein [Gaiellaceae bacterium]